MCRRKATTDQELAEAILICQAEREKTWDEKACAYTKTMEQVVKKYVPNINLRTPVYLLTMYCWEDSREWAETILGREA